MAAVEILFDGNVGERVAGTASLVRVLEVADLIAPGHGSPFPAASVPRIEEEAE